MRWDFAADDPELAAAARGLSARLRLRCGAEARDVVFQPGAVPRPAPTQGDADITVSASAESWDRIASALPPPGFQSFTALQLVCRDVEVSGDPLVIAQARPAAERLFELLRAPLAPTAAPLVRRDLGQIAGRYASLHAEGRDHAVYVEEAGCGPPILFLHTAGADSRQYQTLLSDVDLGARHRLMAFDLPFHGRSLPPLDWDGGAYRLTQDRYAAWVISFIEQAVREPVILVGGSMGAAAALVVAARRPDLLSAAIALEPPLRSTGRLNPYLTHAAVSGGAHSAAYVRGLMSPASPEGYRRRAGWIYSQGAPGVYEGDLAFYSGEFDGAVTGPRIDAAVLPVHLMTGDYDYSATPADGRALAALIPGSRFWPMADLGHFPMTENPDLFRSYFVAVLDALTPAGGDQP